MNTVLYPPLALIERELFGPDLPAAFDADAPDPAQPATAPVMPAHLRALIERKVAANTAHPPGPPAVGQIRSLAGIPAHPGQAPRRRSSAILVGRWIEGRRWAGWMVAQEADYAGERDLVLQDDDGVMAPEAAMVQTWNPLEIELTGAEAILGKVPAATLAAVLKLAAPHAGQDDYVAPRPGRIGAWDLDAETTVVTGTPLGEYDPRSAYQQLYARLATELAAKPATNTAPAVEPGWRAWLRHTFVRPAWTFGALALLVGQSMWMLGGAQVDTQEDMRYRGAALAPHLGPCAARLRLVFKLDTPYEEVVLALRRADATLAGGPSETGEIWVLAPAGQDARELAAMLRQQRVVERVDVVLPEGAACRK